MADTFTCAQCGGTFEYAWSDEEARAEANERHPTVPIEDMAVTCEDCHQKITAWLQRAEKRLGG